MAKKQTFMDKATKKSSGAQCPICDATFQYVRHVKAVRADNGAWKFQTRNTAVCKCNEKEVYA